MYAYACEAWTLGPMDGPPDCDEFIEYCDPDAPWRLLVQVDREWREVATGAHRDIAAAAEQRQRCGFATRMLPA